MEQKPLTEKQQAILNELHKLTLPRRQWIVIYNVLVNNKYTPFDGMIIMDILNKLQPIVAVDTNISEESSNKQKEEAKLTLKKPN